MGVFASDTFTDTAGTALSSHTGEVGATWTYRAIPGAAGNPTPLITDANRARSSVASSSYGFYYASGAPATAEYDVVCDVRNLGAVAGSAGPAARVSTTAGTGYYAAHDSAGSSWTFQKVIAGAFTSLGSFSDAITIGTTRTATLRIRDGLKELYVAGVNGGAALISSADNAITAAGKSGLLFQGAFTNALGLHVDNFAATDAANAVAAASIHARRRRAS